MNPNIEASLVTIHSKMRDIQKAFDDLCKGFVDTKHATIVAKNALEMNKKLARALAYYYTPTEEEYLHFDEHCDAISAAGGCPPDPVEYWGHLAFNHWTYREDE